MATTFTPDEFEASRPGPWRSFWSEKLSSSDTTMSANEQTAYRTTAQFSYCTALSSPSGLYNSYVEVKYLGPGTGAIGIANTGMNVNDLPGGSGAGNSNSLAWYSTGVVIQNGATIASIPGFAVNDVVAIAVTGAVQAVQFRNVTQNSAWSQAFSLASIGQPPYNLAAGFYTVGQAYFANFFGPMLGPVPPGFTFWNPQAAFSEQPVKMISFDAVLLDGSYTSANLNDLEAIPFTRVEWGDAVLDARNNLVFTDWVIGDHPIFSICITVTGGAPSNNWLWAAWDYGTPFVFAKVHIPDANMVAVSNIRIPPPPPLVSPPNVGQGRVLQIFSSCDTAQVFNWDNGHVFGTENVLVWEPIESATRPPSTIGRDATIIANTIQGGSWGPPIGPPL